MHGRGPKLGSYVLLMSFNILKSAIFEKKIDFYGLFLEDYIMLSLLGYLIV